MDWENGPGTTFKAGYVDEGNELIQYVAQIRRIETEILRIKVRAKDEEAAKAVAMKIGVSASVQLDYKNYSRSYQIDWVDANLNDDMFDCEVKEKE